MCVYIERDLFEGIGLHDCGNLQIQSLQGSRPWNSPRPLDSSPKVVCWQDSLLLRRGHTLFNPGLQQIRLSPSQVDRIGSHSASLQIYQLHLRRNYIFTETSRMCDQKFGHHDLARLTHVINHPSPILSGNRISVISKIPSFPVV